MLTIILTSRVKGNPDADIDRMLTSLIACGATPENSEIIIKFDADDEQASIIDLTPYPLTIKRFKWSRGEGRQSIHLDHFYLFAQRNINSKIVMISSDDFIFTRVGFIEEMLEITDEFAIIGTNRPRVELYENNYLEESCMNIWKFTEYVDILPCMTTRTLEVLQNWGWHCNSDNWIILLCILLYKNHKADIWRTVHPSYIRNPHSSATSGYGASFNNMEITGVKNTKNMYYFKLVEQQVKNLYLNIQSSEEAENIA